MKMPPARIRRLVLLSASAVLALAGTLFQVGSASAAEKVPDCLVVLTFDDSVASQATFVAPLLKRLGFGATFFITEGFEFAQDKEHYMTWQQIAQLNADGFEVGNHTRAHKGVNGQQEADLGADIEYIEKQCQANGIPTPRSFCYPGYATSPVAARVLQNRGYWFARAGGARAFDPLKDNPLMMPQAFDGKPASTLEQFKDAVAQAKDGNIAVLTFHGVPDIKHPWVSTEAEKFESYMQHLKEKGSRVVALRDIAPYVAKPGSQP